MDSRKLVVLYALPGAELGSGVRICSSSTLLGNGALEVGGGTWIGHRAIIVASSRVVIGDDVDIATRLLIGTGTHSHGTVWKAAGPGVQREVVIGEAAWIGAGAVVTRNTCQGAFVSGNPVRERDSGDAGH